MTSQPEFNNKFYLVINYILCMLKKYYVVIILAG